MRRLSDNSNNGGQHAYWQLINPVALANTINVIPSGESLLYHGKLIAEGYTFDLGDTPKQFRFARYLEGTLNYLALKQTGANFKSMRQFYFPIIYSLVKRIPDLNTLTYATMFQEFIRYAQESKPPKDDDDIVILVDTYIKRIEGDGQAPNSIG